MGARTERKQARGTLKSPSKADSAGGGWWLLPAFSVLKANILPEALRPAGCSLTSESVFRMRSAGPGRYSFRAEVFSQA